jgi:uncharacterized protein (TIGR00730 family)
MSFLANAGARLDEAVVDEVKRPPARAYSTGDADLDRKIAELIAETGEQTNSELLTEMVTTCFRLLRDDADRGELKLVNAALKEFAYSFKVFQPWREYRKVSIFGSARTAPDEPAYDCTRQFAREMAARNWMVITGAGPGVMAAGHEGAGADSSFGASIRLPLESEPNLFIQGNTKLINFKYFFTRKITFIKESDAFALLPGGFGTLDEAFELLTLMQTGKTDIHPIVLLEEPGSTYWAHWFHFVESELLDRELISKEDLHLLKHARTIHEAADELTTFYSNYDSQRWVNSRLVFRLKRLPLDKEIETLERAFADILGPRGMRIADPSPAEVRDDDKLDCGRIALDFNQTSAGRLRLLIDELNKF